MSVASYRQAVARAAAELGRLWAVNRVWSAPAGQVASDSDEHADHLFGEVVVAGAGVVVENGPLHHRRSGGRPPPCPAWRAIVGKSELARSSHMSRPCP